MNSLLSCSVDADELKGMGSWSAAELSPSQLSEDDDFAPYPAAFPPISLHNQQYGQHERKHACYDESTAKNGGISRTVPVASSSDAIASLSSAFPRKIQRSQAQNDTQGATYCTGSTNEQGAIGYTNSFNSGYARYTSQNQAQPGGMQGCAHDGLRPSANCQVCQERRDLWDLMLTHNMQDFTTTCVKLQLPMDVHDWTPEHTARFLSQKCAERGFAQPTTICIPGKDLLKMSEVDLGMVLPTGASELHQALHMWKTAFNSYSHPQQKNGVVGGGLTANDGLLIKSWEEQQSSSVMAPPQQQQTQMMRAPKMEIPSIDFCDQIMPDHHPDMLLHQEQQQQQQQQQHFMLNVHHMQGYYHPNGQPMMMQSMPQQPPQFFNNFLTNAPTDSESEGDEAVDDDCDLDAPLGQQMIMPQYNPVHGLAMPKQEPVAYHRPGGNVHLWLFIRELLECPEQYGGCVRWVDREEGTFKIESSQNLARFWGCRKNRAAMNYDKLSRSLRQYYKKGIIQKPEKKQRLVYKFLPPYHR